MESSKRFEKAKYEAEREEEEERGEKDVKCEREREESTTLCSTYSICAHAYNAYLIFISYIYC